MSYRGNSGSNPPGFIRPGRQFTAPNSGLAPLPPLALASSVPSTTEDRTATTYTTTPLRPARSNKALTAAGAAAITPATKPTIGATITPSRLFTNDDVEALDSLFQAERAGSPPKRTLVKAGESITSGTAPYSRRSPEKSYAAAAQNPGSMHALAAEFRPPPPEASAPTAGRRAQIEAFRDGTIMQEPAAITSTAPSRPLTRPQSARFVGNRNKADATLTTPPLTLVGNGWAANPTSPAPAAAPVPTHEKARRSESDPFSGRRRGRIPAGLPPVDETLDELVRTHDNTARQLAFERPAPPTIGPRTEYPPQAAARRNQSFPAGRRRASSSAVEPPGTFSSPAFDDSAAPGAILSAAKPVDTTKSPVLLTQRASIALGEKPVVEVTPPQQVLEVADYIDALSTDSTPRGGATRSSVAPSLIPGSPMPQAATTNRPRLDAIGHSSSVDSDDAEAAVINTARALDFGTQPVATSKDAAIGQLRSVLDPSTGEVTAQKIFQAIQALPPELYEEAINLLWVDDELVIEDNDDVQMAELSITPTQRAWKNILKSLRNALRRLGADVYALPKSLTAFKAQKPAAPLRASVTLPTASGSAPPPPISIN